jgi:PLD-like domain
MRDLTGPAQSRAIRDLLQSLFVLEALHPSKTLWLLSAWITDAPIVDNGARQFSAIDPEWGAGVVRLSSVIRTIVERGGRVHLITRRHEINQPFIDQMLQLRRQSTMGLALLVEDDFHDKGLVGDDYELAGSMNFTRKGIETNDEHLILRTDPHILAERHLALSACWKSRIDAANRP